jgi:PhzF family phenazine biosynthesis protein
MSGTTEVLHYAAFTDGGRGGNPAGIMLDARHLDDSARLQVAAAVGYSETAFIEPEGPTGRFRVRYFSPVAEVTFCGHATIATALALAERDGAGRLRFSTLAGLIDVSTTVTPDGLTATLTSVPTRTRPAAPTAVAAALRVLRWTDRDLDPRFPAHVAFAREDQLVIAVRRRDTLAALDYDFDTVASLMASEGWTTLHLVWAEDGRAFHARDPFPPGGIVEDPATGAAAAAFGGYLREIGAV